MVAERLLQRRQLVAVGEALDGLDRRAVGLDGEQHAALHELAVDDHRAGAAVAGVAADVAAGQVEVVAQEVDQQPARLDLALVGRAVDVDRDPPAATRSPRSIHVSSSPRSDASSPRGPRATSARWRRYSLEACTSDGGSRLRRRGPPRAPASVAPPTPASDARPARRRRSRARSRTPPSSDAAALDDARAVARRA